MPLKRLLLLFCWFVCSSQICLAADSLLEADDDDNGIIGSLLTSTCDNDHDGELAVSCGGGDCDDADFLIRNGLPTYAAYEVAKGTCTTSQYRTCTNGTLSSCTSSTYCEKGTCKYVSAAGAGTTCSFASPCLPCYLSTGGAGAAIGTDTAIYLIGSTTAAALCGGDDGSIDAVFQTTVNGTSSAARNVFARYPTSTAVITPSNTSPTERTHISISANNWEVRGFEISGGYGDGILVDGDDVLVRNNWIHDVPGVNNNNLSLVKIQPAADRARVNHNLLSNPSDPSTDAIDGVQQNVWLVTAFDQEGAQVDYNFGGYNHAPFTTPYKTQGGCFRTKHVCDTISNCPSGTKFRYNVAWNCKYPAFRSGAPYTEVRGNLVHKSTRLFYSDEAGDSQFEIEQQVIANNTAVAMVDRSDTAAGVILYYDPDNIVVTPTTGPVFSGNVITDVATAYGGGNRISMIELFHNSSDAKFTALNGKFTFTGNAYYNTGGVACPLTSGFSVWGGNADLGSVVNFTNWKSTYNYDNTGTSTCADLSLSSNLTTSAANGWESEWVTQTTLRAKKKGKKK